MRLPCESVNQTKSKDEEERYNIRKHALKSPMPKRVKKITCNFFSFKTFKSHDMQ